MTARMRRLAADYEQVKKDFAGHKNITVTPVGTEPPEKYNVTYFVNGIYLLPDGRIETLSRHEVEITLHADYPRYKPLCKILTPIWHPNFRDGQICIGDIWGAGESLSDIIINIGDMIQYKSWNSFSPLSADAAQWAIENKHLFPVGNIDLYIADYASAKDSVEISLFDDDGKEAVESADVSAAETSAEGIAEVAADAVGAAADAVGAVADIAVSAADVIDTAAETAGVAGIAAAAGATILANQMPKMNPKQMPRSQQRQQSAEAESESLDGNDFDITAEELEGIEFVPTAQRMQTLAHGGVVKGNKINLKTILVKGLIWALIGAILGFGVSELTKGNLTSESTAARLCGHEELVEYIELNEKYMNLVKEIDKDFEKWCAKNDVDPDDEDSYEKWFQSNEISDETMEKLTTAYEYSEEANQALYKVYVDKFDSDETKLEDAFKSITRMSTALWSAIIALFIGLFLGIGEGIFYGSKEKALMYALIGAGVSLVIGFISGYIAQYMYAEVTTEDPSDFEAAFIRGIGWAIMGLGIGGAVGLIKPELKRILFCCVGGLIGAFIGGFLFNYVCDIIPNDTVARGVALVIMGVLIGVGVGLLEQFAKAAWLKVIRGEFEGKEYLVFAGTTSIGNSGKNTIVLFKDKLVGPHHCDITLEGSKYVLTDCGTPMGTVVNGQRTTRHILRQGDAIAIGNSVLVFNTK